MTIVPTAARIIIEGPDLAGKTTLQAQLVGEARLRYPQLRVRTRHAGPPGPGEHPLDLYLAPDLSWPEPPELLVDDRWHWGEAIYPALLGRPTQMDAAVLMYLELFLRCRGALVVTLNPAPGILHTRYRQRGGDDLVPERQLEDLHLAYRRLSHAQLTHGDSGLSRTPSQLLTEALQVAHASQDLRPFVTYVGRRTPRVLYLGDTRDGASGTRDLQRDWRAPAFLPFPGTSGHYLLRALTSLPDPRPPGAASAAGGWRAGVGIANACDVDDPRELWATLGRPHVVALGRRAHARLRQLGVPHARAPHPQYVRRFHHSHHEAYGWVLRAAATNEEDYSAWRP